MSDKITVYPLCACVNDTHNIIEKSKVVTKKQITQLLETDNLHNYQDVICDIYSLQDVLQNKMKWNFAAPTFSHFLDDGYDFSKLPKDKNELLSRCKSSDPMLNVMLRFLKVPGFVLVGSAVSRLLRAVKNRIKNHSFELYVVGIPDEDVRTRLVTNFHAELIAADPFIESFHVQNSWIWEGNFTIQLQSTHYTTISELLHSIAISAAAVAFDGKQVYFTSLSYLAYTSGLVVLNLTRWSSGFNQLIHTYFGRSFEIVLPDLNVNSAKNGVFKFGNLYNTRGKITYVKSVDKYDDEWFSTFDKERIGVYNISKIISENLQDLCMTVFNNPFDVVPFLPESICEDIVEKLHKIQQQEEQILTTLGKNAKTQLECLYLKTCIIEKPVDLFQKRLIEMTDTIDNVRTRHFKPKWCVKSLTPGITPQEWYGEHYKM
jgi:hypothetical protein